MPNSVQDIVNAWHRFHQEAILAENYRMAPRPPGVISRDPTPNPVVDRLLPSLLLVRVASILDEALEFYINENNVDWPTERKRDFYNRIDVLAENGLLVSKDSCHSVRRRRNDLAHDAQSAASWSELDTYVDKVEDELKGLSFVSDRPRYLWFATCTQKQGTATHPIYILSYGLRDLNGGTPFQVNWEEDAPQNP